MMDKLKANINLNIAYFTMLAEKEVEITADDVLLALNGIQMLVNEFEKEQK